MKLSGKLMIAPLIAIGFLVALGSASYYALTVQQDAAYSFYTGVFERYQAAARVENAVGSVHAGIYRVLSVSEAIGSERLARETAEFKRKLAAAQADLRKIAADGSAEEALLSAARTRLAEYVKAADLAIELGSVDANTGAAAMQTADFAFIEMSKSLAQVVELERKEAE